MKRLGDWRVLHNQQIHGVGKALKASDDSGCKWLCASGTSVEGRPAQSGYGSALVVVDTAVDGHNRFWVPAGYIFVVGRDNVA